MGANRTKALPTLSVRLGETLLFESSGSWLHPLFELETFVREKGIDLSCAEARDKVIGKAAALLMVRLGIGRVHGRLVSSLALGVFDLAGTPISWEEQVPRIGCRTEDLLRDIDDPEVAYEILKERASA